MWTVFLSLLGLSYQECNGVDTVTHMNWSSSVVLPDNLIYLIHYFIVCILLLSGDVELNPGPITGKKTHASLIN